MAKILLQKKVTVTLELSEKEAIGLRTLLVEGTESSTIDSLGLESIFSSLSIKELEVLNVQFKSVASIKK